MKRFTNKRQAQNKAAKPLRDRLIAEAGCCMACGASPKKPNRKYPPELSEIHCHEIYRGISGRLKSLDKPCGILVLCNWCNQHDFDSAKKWPQARQLCLLQYRKPEWYDLEAFNFLVNPRAPNRITQAEVDEFRDTIVLF